MKKGYSFNSIAKKLSLLLLLIIIVTFSITGYLTYSNTRTILVNQYETNLLAHNKGVANELDSFFSEKGTIVEGIATNQSIIAYLKTTESREDALSNSNYDAVNKSMSIAALNKSIDHYVNEIASDAERISSGTEEVSSSMNKIIELNEKAFNHSKNIALEAKNQLELMHEISSTTDESSKMSSHLQDALGRFTISDETPKKSF